MHRSRIAFLAAVVTIGCGCRPQTVFEQLMDARRLTAELLLHFTTAADATNRAVMAGTEKAAASFVREAEQATRDVQSPLDLLRPILTDLRYSKESQLLAEFETKFSEYRALDRRIQELVLESTNLKAQRLSWGPAQQAADAFRDSIEAVDPAAAQTSPKVEVLVARTIASVREIQALQAPHIAESDAGAMTRIEQRMATAEATARGALRTLASLVPPARSPAVASATAALDRFTALNAEILALSRRNSNVQALALSLGQKRILVAAGEETLLTLRSDLANRGFPGTR